MRWRTILVGLVLCLQATMACAENRGTYYVANTTPPDAFLALKNFPSGYGPRIMALANGTRLDVLLRRTDGWWYVKVFQTGEEGWVLSGARGKAYVLCCTDGQSAQPVQESAETSIASFSCQQLWFSRNSIFKEAGYCFKTPQAISAFGNAGCQFDNMDDVPLSSENQALISAIKSTEQMKGCSP